MPLPKEAQQIDRAMEDFAKHYCMCNPSLATGSDSIYAVAFSLLLLHTDAHNKNVKRKMDKDTFIMRTKEIEGGGSFYSEILDIMYDNIIYSEFTYVQQQQDKSSSWFSKKSALPTSPLLHGLYPKLEQLMPAANIFRYKYAPDSAIDMINIYQSIEQARSLPLSGVRYRQQQSEVNRTFRARVCKYGVIERKSDLTLGGKRSSARSWRPFGMALSGSQIMFFGDITQFQSWAELQHQHDQSINMGHCVSLCSEQPNRSQSHKHSLSSCKTNATPTFSSNPSYLSIIPSSKVSVISATPTNTPTNSPSQSYSTSPHLQPIQIVSLSDAVAVYDESYQKYPHVLRLITGDGQQFLIRGDNAEDIDDWIQKINYVSAMKSTGVRLRPRTIKPAVLDDNMNESRVTLHKGYHPLGIHYYNHLDGHPSQNWAKQEAKAQAMVVSLSQQRDEHKRQLEKDKQLRNQLMILIPGQKATKDRMLVFAETIGKRLMHERIVLRRLECYQELIETELLLYQLCKHSERRDNGSRRCDHKGNTVTQSGNPAVTPILSDPSLYHHEQSISTNQLWGSSFQGKSTNHNDTPSSLPMDRMDHGDDTTKTGKMDME